MKRLTNLPEDAKQVEKIWDLVIINPHFDNNHKRKKGDLFIKSVLSEGYEQYEFTDSVTSKKVKSFIISKQLFFREK